MVRIAEHGYVGEIGDAGYLSDVLRRVTGQLRSLRDGHYLKHNDRSGQEVQSLLVADTRKSYDRAFGVVETATAAATIKLSDLREELRARAKAGCVFDVTALKNNLLVDVVLTLVALHSSEIYSFELRKRPVYDQQDLYHALSGDDYTYRNLTESDPVSAAVQRIRRWTIGGQFYLVLVVVVLLVAVASGFVVDSPETAAVISKVADVVSILALLIPIVRQYGD